MSSALRRCTACGFEPIPPAARFCEHCGHPLCPPGEALSPGPGSSLAPGLASEPSGTLSIPPARFAALTSHPDLPRLLATPPEIPELAGGTLPSILLLAALTIFGGFAALLSFQLCPPLGFVPLALVVLAAGLTVRQLLTNARTRLVARPAAIVERRARLQAGARHSHDHTRHLVVLELPGGERVEREAYLSALPDLTPGRLGVAYEKGERLAAFVALPV